MDFFVPNRIQTAPKRIYIFEKAAKPNRAKWKPQISPLRYAPVEMTILLLQQICHLDRSVA
jgi:hypothetical protein